MDPPRRKREAPREAQAEPMAGRGGAERRRGGADFFREPLNWRRGSRRNQEDWSVGERRLRARAGGSGKDSWERTAQKTGERRRARQDRDTTARNG